MSKDELTACLKAAFGKVEDNEPRPEERELLLPLMQVRSGVSGSVRK
jgi:hypothetical protein